ncbi:hypothetical protein B296_00056947, partial [Ensete ventricosum]
ALTPLTPFTSLSPSLLPLRRRRLPLPVGSHPNKGRPPLRPTLPPLLEAGLVAGDQASSSLAVSIQWISAVKLLQYDLETLAKREGGE